MTFLFWFFKGALRALSPQPWASHTQHSGHRAIIIRLHP